MGFDIGDPYALQLENDRTDTILSKIKKNLEPTTQMVPPVLNISVMCDWDALTIVVQVGIQSFSYIQWTITT